MVSTGPAATDQLNDAAALLPESPAAALQAMRPGLLSLPECGVGWYNYGIAEHLCGRIEAAVRAYQVALRYPDAPQAALANNLSQALLLAGQFQVGWEWYERRPQATPHQHLRRLLGPPWDPSRERRPTRLLLAAEQGYGDTLMMGQLAVWLSKQGWELGLWCQPALVGLFKAASPLTWVSDAIPAPGQFDGWLPLLSLPRLLQLRPETVPLASGYLQLSDALVQQWSERLRRRSDHLLIGLHWQGNPRSEVSFYTRERSLQLSALAPLASLPNVEVVSIQKGAGSEQWPGPFRDKAVAGQAAVSASRSFLDTAAVLANCDLLISADSAVVHLAGALGCPAWVLLKAIPEWRWGLSGSRSYWFNQLRLFRQPHPGAWQPLVSQVCATLAQR